MRLAGLLTAGLLDFDLTCIARERVGIARPGSSKVYGTHARRIGLQLTKELPLGATETSRRFVVAHLTEVSLPVGHRPLEVRGTAY